MTGATLLVWLHMVRGQNPTVGMCVCKQQLWFSGFLFPELYDICLARAKEKWRSLSTGGAEVECEGMFFVNNLCCVTKYKTW